MASFYLRKRFRHVTIIPGDGFDGAIYSYSPKFIKYFEGWSFERQRNFAEIQIIILLGGTIAQRKFKPQSIRRYQTLFDEESEGVSFSFISSFEAKEREAYWKWLGIKTENLIESHWNDVKAVAEALLQRETLTYEDVYEIIRGYPIPEITPPKNDRIEAIMKMIKSREISPQEAIDAMEAQTIEANSKEEEKWMLQCRQL